MRSRRSATEDPEFPLMNALGLYASDIRGDGNCLFNALSDQYFGDQEHHREIRERVCDYVEANAKFFKSFVSVNPGGGVRRNPKRKNTNAYSTPYDKQKPTEEEIDRVFSEHVKMMRQGGTWGDNVEIQAFARAYNCFVKIWNSGHTYEVAPFAGQTGKKAVVHLAYHSWEHYSSVRNIEGPHTGVPRIHLRHLSPEAQAAMKQKLPVHTQVEDWQVDLVQQSIHFFVEKPIIKKLLTQHNCDIDIVVSKFMHEQDSREQSSAQESSSIEREHDSDDDEIYGPNKRRNNTSVPRSERSELPRSTTPSTTPPSSVDSRPKLTAKSRIKRAGSATLSRSSSRESTAGSESHPSQSTESTRRRPVVHSDNDAHPPEPAGPQPKKKSASTRSKRDWRKQAQNAAHRERKQLEEADAEGSHAEKSSANLPIITKSSRSDSDSPHYPRIKVISV
ncbi:uncharacterized protein IWZ02DRAFT_372533 [Phyllosticta citriasiana]|uniref:OTU domain-containing protein n=1 Tax=Phyllosticta citriasiana TaxID=595635 RepID=A0ABR1KAP6_9PEZI